MVVQFHIFIQKKFIWYHRIDLSYFILFHVLLSKHESSWSQFYMRSRMICPVMNRTRILSWCCILSSAINLSIICFISFRFNGSGQTMYCNVNYFLPSRVIYFWYPTAFTWSLIIIYKEKKVYAWLHVRPIRRFHLIRNGLEFSSFVNSITSTLCSLRYFVSVSYRAFSLAMYSGL